MKNRKWIQFMMKHSRRIIAFALALTLLLSLTNLGTIRALIRRISQSQDTDTTQPTTAPSAPSQAIQSTQPTQPEVTLSLEEELELALTYLTEDIGKDPTDPELYTQRAAVYYNLGMMQEAIEDYTTAISLSDTHQTRYHRAIVYTASGYTVNAYLDLSAALKAEPDNQDYLSLMSDTCNALERYDEALVCLEKLLVTDPDNCILQTLAADACVYTGNYEAAAPHYQQAIACYTDDVAENGIALSSLYSAYANTLKTLGFYIDAAEAYSQTLALTDSKEFYFQRGFCLLQSGSYADAIADFTKCIELDYETAFAHFQRALCHCATYDYYAAINDFKVYEEAFPEKTDSFLYMGLCYQNVGLYGYAITYYYKCIEANISPSSCYFNIGNCYYSDDDYANAIDAYTNAIRFGGFLYESLLNRGICYIQLNKYNEAKADLKRVIDECSDPDLVESASKSYEPIKNITIITKG